MASSSGKRRADDSVSSATESKVSRAMADSTGGVVRSAGETKKYEVWFRHSGQPVSDRLPFSVEVTFRKLTVGEVVVESAGNAITHMLVKGDFPPLPTPTLTHLSIHELKDVTQLEDCLSALVQLQVLDVRFSNIGRVPDALSQLTTLKQLNLTSCKLTALPDSLSALQQLELLDVSLNDFISETIAVIGELSRLRQLELYNCNLAELPDSFSKLTELQVLDISNRYFGLRNRFVDLPPVIYKMNNLLKLDVRRNSDLLSIREDILKLHKLRTLNCDDCDSMTYPPYSVSRQGLDAVKLYFEDLKKGKSRKLAVAPVAIVGNLMAGKTSLVRTLQQGKRVFTVRSEELAKDEATKVFKVEDLTLENSPVKLIDYGGHNVYHLTYQLVIREECIPVIVVNLEEFHNLAEKRGSKEATRRVCFDWLSHLYLACPRLGPPLLVLTHTDKLTTDQTTQCRTELFQQMETIRRELLAEESLFAKGSYKYLGHMIFFSNSNDVLIKDPINVFHFGHGADDALAIQSLKTRLAQRCEQFQRVIPERWVEIETAILADQENSFITLKEVEAKYPECHVILRYMHNTGKVLWFESDEELSGYIFHQIPALTDMISLLFHHSRSEQWKQLTSFTYGESVITEEEQQRLALQFLKTGVIDEGLLENLISSSSTFRNGLGLKILRSFCIAHGPIRTNIRNCYILPYFSTTYIGDSMDTNRDLEIKSEIVLLGLPIPAYGYHMVTVEVLNATRAYHSRCRSTVANNGAVVHHGDSSTLLCHDYNSKKISLQVYSNVNVLGKSWKLLLEMIKRVLNMLSDVWKASRAKVLFYCSHCLFLKNPNPHFETNPSWFYPIYQRSGGKQLVKVKAETFTGVESETCEWHASHYKTEEPTVPRPLVLPCYKLTDKEVVIVKEYLTGIEGTFPTAEPVVEPSPIQPPTEDEPVEGSESTNPVSTGTVQASGEDIELSDEEEERQEEPGADDVREAVVTQPSDEAEAGTGQQTPDPDMTRPVQVSRDQELAIIGQQPYGDLERFCDMRSADNIIIDLPLQPVERDDIKQLYYNTTEVYRTSAGIRGRFLIINVLTGLTGPAAEGCKVDADNLKRLFSSLGFDQSNYGRNVRNWTAQKIYDVIESETRHPDHQRHGMFVLAILCHGGREDRLADCNNQPVDLMNIKDLLCSQQFPAMEGKPKLVITSACSGSRQDCGNSRRGPQTRSLPSTPAAGSAQDNLPSATALNADDFLLMKGSSESYASTVFSRHGTWFIRVLVITFYQHSNHQDLESLFKIIQHRVRKLSMEHESFRQRGGNVPSSTCTFTNFRKLFLFPGYSPPPQ